MSGLRQHLDAIILSKFIESMRFRKPVRQANMPERFAWGFFFGVFWGFGEFFGFRAPGWKKARQEATVRKDRKEGRKEGGQEGSKEGRKYGGTAGRKEGRREGRKEGRDRVFVRWKHWQQRYFLLNPEPKPYGPKALDHNALRTARP